MKKEQILFDDHNLNIYWISWIYNINNPVIYIYILFSDYMNSCLDALILD